jgi:uncharacterized membrane protein YdcZ (DUF606 family)
MIVFHSRADSKWWDWFGITVGTVFHLLYVILVNLVLSAIVSGLIIDTFGWVHLRCENRQHRL